MTDYIEDTSDELKYSVPRITYSDVAAKLLQDNFLLAALELHTELVESGREVPQLKEFFSNPGNFERPSIDVSLPIARSPSQATLDSLDLARLSEDGEKNGDVAVLEFELRKARETINSLRANLTQAADFEVSSVDLGCEKLIREDPLKPHEKRALNFLINEYLLLQDYKLTSITFADEIPEQDFEDWDDVGLNLPRPAGLISMYRGENVSSTSKVFCDGKTQTQDVTVTNDTNSESFTSPEEKAEWIAAKDEEVSLLKKQILALETDKVNYQKLYDAALASLNSLSSPTSDMPSSETTLYTLQNPFKDASTSGETIQLNCVDLDSSDNLDQDLQPLPQSATQNYYGSSVSTHSVTPDQFEMIDSDKNGGSSQKDGSNTSSFEPAILADDIVINSLKSVPDSPTKRKESITTLEDTFSLNDTPESDWPRGQFMENIKSSRDGSIIGGKNEAWINSNIPSEYKSALMKSCNLPYTKGNELLNDIAGNSQAITPQRLVYVVSATLPKIVPNLLLVKRDEVIGLLICAIFLHPEQSQRDKLLQILLNLKKKMEKEDRALIISGLVILLQWNTEVNSGLDSDLLGLCWEMLSSKSVEKRLLGAEASIALAPYISLDLLSSLLLSMVVSMCDSSDNLIRRQGLLGSLLVCPSAAATKFSQLESILYGLLMDKDTAIGNMCIKVLAPVLARSSLLNGIFHSEFCVHLLDRLKTALRENKSETSVSLLKMLNSTVNMALIYVVNVPIIKEKDPMNELSYGELSDKKASEYFHINPFCNPKFLVEDQVYNPYQLINIFYELLESDKNISWDERDWFINTYMNTLLDILVNNFQCPEDIAVVIAYIELFESICVIFGANFAASVIRPRMEAEILKIEQRLAKLESQKPCSAAVVSVFLGAVLATAENEEKNVGNIIKRWSICSGMCSVPCAILGIPIIWFSNKKKNLLDIALSALWESVVHTSEQVRAFAAGLFTYLVQHATLPDNVLNGRVVPAIVTLVSDSAATVKCRAIRGLGALISRIDIPPSIADKCWVSLEGLAREERSTGSLGCRSTACLAGTLAAVLSPGDVPMANKVLPHLSMLCFSPIFSSENVSSIRDLLTELLPALQMATHENISEHFVQNVLLPSLRNLAHLDNLLTSEHKSAIEALIHRVSLNSSNRDHHHNASSHSHVTSPVGLPGILANPESVGRRVSQMFQHSKPAMNLQNIFKKKT